MLTTGYYFKSADAGEIKLNPICNSFPKSVSGTLKNADFANSKKSAFFCALRGLRPAKAKTGVALVGKTQRFAM